MWCEWASALQKCFILPCFRGDLCLKPAVSDKLAFLLSTCIVIMWLGCDYQDCHENEMVIPFTVLCVGTSEQLSVRNQFVNSVVRYRVQFAITVFAEKKAWQCIYVSCHTKL